MRKLSTLAAPVKRWFDEVPIAIGIKLVSGVIGFCHEPVPVRVANRKLFRDKK